MGGVGGEAQQGEPHCHPTSPQSAWPSQGSTVLSREGDTGCGVAWGQLGGRGSAVSLQPHHSLTHWLAEKRVRPAPRR